MVGVTVLGQETRSENASGRGRRQERCGRDERGAQRLAFAPASLIREVDGGGRRGRVRGTADFDRSGKKKPAQVDGPSYWQSPSGRPVGESLLELSAPERPLLVVTE